MVEHVSLQDKVDKVGKEKNTNMKGYAIRNGVLRRDKSGARIELVKYVCEEAIAFVSFAAFVYMIYMFGVVFQ